MKAPGNNKGTYRLGPNEDVRLDQLKVRLGQTSRSDVLRVALRALEDCVDRSEDRQAGLITRLADTLDDFDPSVRDSYEAGFNLRRDFAWVRIGDTTYTDAPEYGTHKQMPMKVAV